MDDVIPFGDKTKNMFIVVIPEFVAKKALESGGMTTKQWEKRNTHALKIYGFWVAISPSIKCTLMNKYDHTRY